ncbi:hypothetical protein QJS04_geneDACA014705 [Acorus gramineus]|uniref:HAT C-terminal dimerisation domain-containing protein n=1 Tax=Acorus gramineus TaxID=55184 RepID=A0AAV9B697_ACOGR|nr:hypothetical protein QJS04_geneDACA014705 [Acorus gramineus]
MSQLILDQGVAISEPSTTNEHVIEVDDSAELASSSNKRKLTSQIWLEFDKVIKANGAEYAKYGLEEIKEMIQKIQNSVKYVKRTTSAKQKFQHALNQVKMQGRRKEFDLVEYWYVKLYGEEASRYIMRALSSLVDLFTEYEVACPFTLIASSSGSSAAPSASSLGDKWKINSPKLPTLGRMARDILATSVASEAAFNVGGRILDDSCLSLNPYTVDALVAVQD